MDENGVRIGVSAWMSASCLALILLSAAQGFAELPVQSNFEDGTPQGWSPLGGETLANTTEASNTGTHSLKRRAGRRRIRARDMTLLT